MWTNKVAFFSRAKTIENVIKYSSSYTLGPNYISWSHLKEVTKDFKCIINIINIVNTYINLSYWPSYFKKLTFIIIPKPNKLVYNNPKAFCPIVLLNTLGKLIKKVISNRIQVHLIASKFLHPNQLDSIKQYLITNTSLFLTYLIQSE